MAKKEKEVKSRMKLSNLDLIDENFHNPIEEEKLFKGIALKIDTYYQTLFNKCNNQYFIQSNKPKGYIHMANKFYVKAYEVFRDHFLKEMGVDSVTIISEEELNYFSRTGRRASYSLSSLEEGTKKTIQLTIPMELWKEMYSFIFIYYKHKENNINFHIYSLTYFLADMLLWYQKKDNWDKLFK